ncbi:MAG: hypothetical protein JNK72_13635 [Myxococcales bacterium]|nr:hypothetical protein [Myxococcales bacterium]
MPDAHDAPQAAETSHDERPEGPDGEVLIAVEFVSVPRRIVVSLGTGAALVGFALYLQWAFRLVTPDRAGLVVGALGAAVSLAMVAAAFRSQKVYRITLDRGEGRLKVWRDPGVLEQFALAELKAVESVPPVGGWSRDPSERLVLTLSSGARRVFELPDEADTPAIVRDLTRAPTGDAQAT